MNLSMLDLDLKDSSSGLMKTMVQEHFLHVCGTNRMAAGLARVCDDITRSDDVRSANQTWQYLRFEMFTGTVLSRAESLKISQVLCICQA